LATSVKESVFDRKFRFLICNEFFKARQVLSGLHRQFYRQAIGRTIKAGKRSALVRPSFQSRLSSLCFIHGQAHPIIAGTNFQSWLHHQFENCIKQANRLMNLWKKKVSIVKSPPYIGNDHTGFELLPGDTPSFALPEDTAAPALPFRE
jgi:hypothetical protein